MEESILKIAEQFEYVPEIMNVDALKPAERFVLGGMGGSHLHADILRASSPSVNLVVHSDYGLAPEPHVPPTDMSAKENTLFIASSYSGNTEEVLDFAMRAKDKGYDLACIAIGGKLLEFAQKHHLPYIQIPDTGIQPRSALGFALMALAKFVQPELLPELAQLSSVLKPESLREQGVELAETLRDHIPVINSSTTNAPVAYNWKIKFNETGKIPAFYNVFPELNHNEMQGFDPNEMNRHLTERIMFIFIRDDQDHERVKTRMDVCERMYEERGYEVVSIRLTGRTYFERVFNSLILADWVALKTAEMYRSESEAVPMIEEFKQKIV